VTGRRSLKDKMRPAVLTERIDVAGPEVAIFRVRPKEGPVFEFKAGQYATLGLDVGDGFVARAYSIASSPYEREDLEFYVNEIKEGELTPSLFRLRVGDELFYMGPKGVFTLAKSSASHLLFIATGTGLAPYMSILRTLHADQRAGRPHRRTITLVHGVRHTSDLAYRWELDGYQRERGFGLLYLPMVSRPDGDPFWTPELGRGRTTALLDALGEAGADTSFLPEGLHLQGVTERLPPDDTGVFLCGNPDMIADAKAILAGKGYRQVYTEEYW
jgi:ferredoxin--NADP+ reductase